MPRYIFSWLEGGDAAILDDTHVDLPDFESARQEAHRALAERAAELGSGPDGRGQTVGIAIRDASGNFLLRKYVKFTDDLQ